MSAGGRPPAAGADLMIDSDKLIRWYDFQARFYRLWRNRYDSPLVDRVAALTANRGGQEPAAVLDAGCGTGLFTIGLARADAGWRVEGLDASSGMLAVAVEQAAKHGLQRARFRQGDVTALPYADGEFDVVTAAGVIPCLNEPGVALREFHRVLRPRGRLVSVEFDRGSMGLPLRLFFQGLILGFKCIALFRPGFRYAERWNIKTSTVDLPVYETELRAAGFRPLAVERLSGHVIYHLAKDES